MTKHPPNCNCDLCFVTDLNAAVLWFAEQREARQAEQYNAQVMQDNRERENWRDTFIDRDAEQLAADVVREQVRVAG